MNFNTRTHKGWYGVACFRNEIVRASALLPLKLLMLLSYVVIAVFIFFTIYSTQRIPFSVNYIVLPSNVFNKKLFPLWHSRIIKLYSIKLSKQIQIFGRLHVQSIHTICMYNIFETTMYTCISNAEILNTFTWIYGNTVPMYNIYYTHVPTYVHTYTYLSTIDPIKYH